MFVKLHPVKSILGELAVPPDKSITHRAVFLSALGEGRSIINNPLSAQDCLSSLMAVQALGCDIGHEPNRWVIGGVGLRGFKRPKEPLDCGNSGTTMRLLSGILAAQDFESKLSGDDSLSQRPMDRVANPLMQMGADIHLRDNRFPPMTIKGTRRLKAIRWQNPISSAQVKSCVLLAGLHCDGVTSFSEPSLSRDHTERMLQSAGVSLTVEGNTVTLQGPARIRPQEWSVPGDFSSSAFFIAGGLLVEESRLVMRGVNLNPTRTGFLNILERMGAKLRIDRAKAGGEPVGDIIVEGRGHLKSLEIDGASTAQFIDEVPILAVVATQAKGVTILRGLSELRLKETDRVKAVATNLIAMGARVTEEADSLTIEGPCQLKGAEVDSFGDHRIAMSFAIAALLADGETTIKNSECVNISYPHFWEDLNRLSTAER